jgi:O-antigen ligase
MTDTDRSTFREGAVVVVASVVVGVGVAMGRPSLAAAVLSLLVLVWVFHRPHLGLWGMILLLPLAPGFPRSLIDRSLDFLLPLLTLGLLYVQSRQRGRPVLALPRELTLWFLAFVAWTAFTSFFSTTPIKGFAQAFRYCFVFIAVACFWNLWDLATLRRGFFVLAMILVFVAGYGVVEFSALGVNEVIHRSTAEAERLSSFYNNANDLGAWMGHGLLILIPFLLLRASRPWTLARGTTNILLVAAAALLLGGALISFSRASYLYLLAGTLLLALCHRRMRWIAISGLGGILVFLLVFPLPPWVAAGLRLGSGTSFRTSLWSAGWHMMLDHPWTGVGTGSGAFSLSRAEYLSPDVFTGLLKIQAGGAHNVFISRGAEMGIPGLLLAVLLFVMLWIRVPRALRAYQRGDWLAGTAAAGVVGLTVRGMFERSHTLGLGNVADSLLFFLFALILLGYRSWESRPGLSRGFPATPSN